MRKINRGFTLVELMMVVAILGIVVVFGSGMFISLLRGSAKTNVLTEVKQNGNYSLNVMERMIRSARGINTCTSGMEAITIENPDGGLTTFDCSGSQISSNSADLISNQVELVSGSCSFDCDSGTSGLVPDRVTINFSLKQVGDAGRPEEEASVDFQSQVTLRNLN